MVVLATVAFVPVALAQSPVQLSLMNPVQLVPESESIKGVSLGALYTVNRDVTGINWTFGVNKLTGDMAGWQGGLVNLVEGDVWGYQEGFFNKVTNVII